MQSPAIALAWIEGSSWNWELKLDEFGLFRWYLNGTVETSFGGFSASHAESALDQFVDETLRGELKINHLNERVEPGSESGHHPAVKSAGMN